MLCKIAIRSFCNWYPIILPEIQRLMYICPEYRKMIYHYKDAPIFYQITGEGPVVVLLHGFLESSSMWQGLIPTLETSKKVILIDLPGHGQSGNFSEVHAMELMASVVFSLLKHLKIDRIELIGHSMGGYVGLAFLEAYGGMVDKFTLLNSTTLPDSEVQKQNRDRAARLISENKKSFINNIMNVLFIPTAQQSYRNEIAKLKDEAQSFSEKGIIAATLGMKQRPDRTAVLKQFNNEKVIICGDVDPVVPLTSSKAIAAATQARLEVLKGGHMSWVENLEELVNLCT